MCTKNASTNRPKIMLIDMPQNCATALENEGHNISIASFGLRKRVPPSENYHWIGDLHELPVDTLEQDIIFIDTDPSPQSVNPPEQISPKSIDAVYQTPFNGLIDSAPLLMRRAIPVFSRMWMKGTLFFVFSSGIREAKYTIGKYNGHHWGGGSRLKDSYTSWSFLPELGQTLSSQRVSGTEMIFDSGDKNLDDLLGKAAEGSKYSQVLHRSFHSNKYADIGKNVSEEDVAIFYQNPKSSSFFMVFPKLLNFHLVISDFINTFCADRRPDLFPDLEGQQWVHREEYELEEILKIEKEIHGIEAETQARVQNLGEEILTLRKTNSDHYALLTGGDDRLVLAVINTLKTLGFSDVRDIDKVIDAEGDEEASRREDLQIHDKTPILILDVKGIKGCPTDSDTGQAQKHATMRMREWDSTDVQSLMIINSQKNLPPNKRSKQAYRIEMVKNAEDLHAGLMTTWDLFCLKNNAKKLGWKKENILPIFYRTGRIEPIPANYTLLGKILETFKSAIILTLSESINVGDRVSIEIGEQFVEFDIQSLQVASSKFRTICEWCFSIPFESAGLLSLLFQLFQ